MSNATQKTEGASPENLAKRARFEGLYSEWHAARGALDHPDRPEDDGSSSARSRRVDAAERALLTTPAPLPWGIFMKWEVLDYLVTNEAETGAYTDNRVIVAVAAI